MTKRIENLFNTVNVKAYGEATMLDTLCPYFLGHNYMLGTGQVIRLDRFN